MNLKKRLLYYGLGFGMGLVLVLLFFNLRGCEWLPGNRVMSAIRSSQIIISSNNYCKLKCNDISEEDIFTLINNGDVDFTKSNTKERKKQYFISNSNIEISFELYAIDSTAEIINVKEKTNCSCGKGDTLINLYMPNQMMLSKLGLKDIRKKDLFLCQLSSISLDTNIIHRVLKEGEILYNLSLPKRKPNPLFIIKLDNYIFLLEEGASKVRFKQAIEINDEIIFDNNLMKKIRNNKFINSCS